MSIASEAVIGVSYQQWTGEPDLDNMSLKGCFDSLHGHEHTTAF
jgi:hypothetical protein